jgi:Ni/Co efflux regulator RcnB
MIRLSLAIALLAAPATGMAQQQTSNAAQQAESGKGVQRIRNVQLQKGEKCPTAQSDDEIVVCGTQEEPYRIPKTLRESRPDAVQQSWANRASTIDDVSREAAGLPNTCSPVGSGGQTGCVSKLLRNYADEKREQRRAAESVP